MAGHGDRRHEPPLARIDVLGELLGELDQLRAEARRLLPPAPAGAAPPPCPEATDITGSVRVVVDPDGQATAVEIGGSWRSRLGPEGLAAALFETYHAARAEALAAEALAAQAVTAEALAAQALAAEALAGGDPDPGAAPAAVPPDSGRSPAPEPAGFLAAQLAALRLAGDPAAEPWEQLAALRGRLDRVRITQERLSQLGGLALPGTRERTGRYGYLTARLRGPAIVGITSDARIWSAATEELQQDALDVLAPGRAERPDPDRPDASACRPAA